MNARTFRSTSLAGSMVAVVFLSACSSDSHRTRADMAEAELDALQEAFGEEELTPDAITALRNMVATLMGRADITPEDLQSLRDQVDSLTGRADITPEALQALRDQVNTLMGRADISPEALQALRDSVDSLNNQMETLRFAASVPVGLARSTAAPLHAMDADDTLADVLWGDPTSQAAPLTSTLRRDTGVGAVTLTDDAHVKTISTDGNEGIRVTYVFGGEERTIHFQSTDFLDDGAGGVLRNGDGRRRGCALVPRGLAR